MCNELYEQIRQVAQRSAERVVDLLCAGVGRDLGGQARQQPSQRLRTMTLQREEVLELALGAQHREVGAQVRPREAPEVALAAKARPLGEDRQRQDLLVAQEGGTAGAACGRGVVGLPPVVYLDVQ